MRGSAVNESPRLAVWTEALNLPEYEVVHYAEQDGQRHFSIVPHLMVEACPECGRPCQRIHQKRWIRDVVDLPLGDRPVRLKVRVYQYHCEHCGRMWTPPSLLLTPGGGGARASARFVGQAAAFIRRADIAGAAAYFGVPETTLARWYYGHAQHDGELGEADGAGEPIRSLGIDELSLKKSTGSSSP